MTATEQDLLAQAFETHRPHLRAVAFRMLGSLAEAEDAVQESWLRLQRSAAGPEGQGDAAPGDRAAHQGGAAPGDSAAGQGIDNLGGWLTAVVARVSLDQLRSRRARREEPAGATPAAAEGRPSEAANPEEEAALADAVGLALLVVLGTLAPAERLAFVLHDLFAVSFDEIAKVVGRSEPAVRQLASRARRRVQGGSAIPEADRAELGRQRAVVEAFLKAARGGDLEGLLAVLDPDVVLRADPQVRPKGAPTEVRGAAAVAGNATRGASPYSRPALVNGRVGLVVAPRGRLRLALQFTIAGGRITGLEVIADPARLAALELAVLDDQLPNP